MRYYIQKPKHSTMAKDDVSTQSTTSTLSGSYVLIDNGSRMKLINDNKNSNIEVTISVPTPKQAEEAGLSEEEED